MTLIRCTAKSQPSQQHRSRQPREVVLCASALPDWQAKKEGRLPLG
jgi:hypothetical protein